MYKMRKFVQNAIELLINIVEMYKSERNYEKSIKCGLTKWSDKFMIRQNEAKSLVRC